MGAPSTVVTGGTVLKVYGWHDNEMGCACRMWPRPGSGAVGSSTAIPSASGTRNRAIVTAAHWGFALTDGALRMPMQLRFPLLGRSPSALAFLICRTRRRGSPRT